MAKKVIARSPRSWVLEIIIVIFIVILILAILVPKKQWKKQIADETLCRQRMENIYFASRFYHRSTHSYTNEIKEILSYAEKESITVHPAGFKLDRLTRADSGIDSFQVDYYDPYSLFSHYERNIHFRFIDPVKRDSVVLEITPKQRYADFVPKTYYCFATDLLITVITDDRGDQGCFTMVGAQGKLRGMQILGEQLTVPANNYIYNIDIKDLDLCPTTGTPFNLQTNVKLGIIAEMQATLHKMPVENSLASSRLLSSIVVFQMLKKADALTKRSLLVNKTFEAVEDSLITAGNEALLDSIANSLRAKGLETLATAIHDSTLDSYDLDDENQVTQWEEIRDLSYNYMNQMKEDSTLKATRDKIINEINNTLITENFQAQLDKVLSEAALRVVESGFINTISDSVDHYSDPDLIRKRLFKAHEDSVTKSKLSDEKVADLLSLFSYEETYRISKVDSVGITISCTIEGRHRKSDISILDRIFVVKGSENHGNIENGDLSWSEKR